MPNGPFFPASSGADDPDAVAAAALDNRAPEYPTDAFGLDIEGGIEGAEKIYDAAQQQTPDTKFLRAGDIISSLLLGAGAVATGGLSLIQGAGIAMGGGEMMRRDRVANEEAQNQQTEMNFAETAAGLTMKEANMQIADMQQSGSGSRAGFNSSQALKTLEMAWAGGPEAYGSTHMAMSRTYPELAYLDYATMNSYHQNKFVTDNPEMVMNRAQEFVERGNPNQAIAMLGPRYAPYLTPQSTSWAEAIGPQNADVMELLLTQRDLDAGAVDQIMKQITFAYDRDPEGMQSVLDMYRQIPSNSELLKNATDERVRLTIAAATGDAPEYIKETIKAWQQISDITGDLDLMRDPEMRRMYQEQESKLFRVITSWIGNRESQDTGEDVGRQWARAVMTSVMSTDRAAAIEEQLQTVEGGPELQQGFQKLAKEIQNKFGDLLLDDVSETTWALVHEQLMTMASEMGIPVERINQPDLLTYLKYLIQQTGSTDAK